MALLDDVKTLLRISGATTAFDAEITDLIDAAKADLGLSGVTDEKVNDDADPLIRRAIATYVKGRFGWDNPDAERLGRAYDLLKGHLTLSREYGYFTVTFSVTDGATPLEDAIVAFNGEERITDSTGTAVFTGVNAQQNAPYSVTLAGFATVEDVVDVAGSVTVPVTLGAV